MELVDRDDERDTLDRLVASVRAGESRALVVSGEAGVGKTALLDYLAGNASGCRVVRTAGYQSEMELAFAALHQLCAPLLEGLTRLPVPQRDALRIAFGMGSGPTPDRFLVGLAVLNLLSDAAEPQPLLCVVDDEQWLDRASAQVLGFVARRLVAESVGMVFAARVPSTDIAGLSDLTVEGLPEADARALLDSALTGPLDTRVRDQILAETHGNPLALLELPRGLTPQQLAGGFGLPGAMRLCGGVEESFRRRFDVLPVETRRLLLIAAAEPVGDQALVWRAAAKLGVKRRSGGAGDRGGPGRVRHAGSFSASSRAVDGLRVGVGAGAAEGACGSCSGHRSAAGPRSTRLASGPCRAWAGRGSRRGAGAIGGQGASAWRRGSGCGIPRARDHVDTRPDAANRAGVGRGVGQLAGRRVRCGAAPAVRRGGWGDY